MGAQAYMLFASSIGWMGGGRLLPSTAGSVVVFLVFDVRRRAHTRRAVSTPFDVGGANVKEGGWGL